MVPTIARRQPDFGPSLPPGAALADLVPGALPRLVATSRLVRFLIVGSGGLAVDALVFALLSGLGAADAAARAVSLATATLVTWQLNRRFTFAASGRAAQAEAGRYVAVAFCAQGFNYGLFLGLRALLPLVWPLATLLASAVCAAAFSFAGQSLVTFRPAGEAVR